MARLWFPLYHGDYLRDTVELSPSEHGIYLLLLMNFFQRGPLPDDLSRLCRIAASADPEEVRGILERYWVRTEDGWINERMQKERDKSLEYNKKFRESGRKGGLAKAKKKLAPLQAPLVAPLVADRKHDTNTNTSINTCTYIASPNVIYTKTYGEECQNRPAASARATVPYAEIRDAWIEILPELQAPLGVEHWTEARKRLIRARWNDQLPDMEAWRDLFTHIRKSKFLMGQTSKPFRCTLQWVAKPENLLKIAEGNYHGQG